MAHHGCGFRALVSASVLLLSALVTGPARADTERAIKQGTQVLGEWVDGVWYVPLDDGPVPVIISTPPGS